MGAALGGLKPLNSTQCGSYRREIDPGRKIPSLPSQEPNKMRLEISNIAKQSHHNRFK